MALPTFWLRCFHRHPAAVAEALPDIVIRLCLCHGGGGAGSGARFAFFSSFSRALDFLAWLVACGITCSLRCARFLDRLVLSHSKRLSKRSLSSWKQVRPVRTSCNRLCCKYRARGLMCRTGQAAKVLSKALLKSAEKCGESALPLGKSFY